MIARIPQYIFVFHQNVMHLKEGECLGCSEIRFTHKPTCTIKHEGKGLLGERFPCIAGWGCTYTGLFGERGSEGANGMKKV